MTPPAPDSSGGFPVTHPCLRDADFKRHEEAIARVERAQQEQALAAVQTRGVLRGTRRDLQALDRRLERIERGLSGKSLMTLAQTIVTIATGALVLWAAFHGNLMAH